MKWCNALVHIRVIARKNLEELKAVQNITNLTIEIDHLLSPMGHTNLPASYECML